MNLQLIFNLFVYPGFNLAEWDHTDVRLSLAQSEIETCVFVIFVVTWLFCK